MNHNLQAKSWYLHVISRYFNLFLVLVCVLNEKTIQWYFLYIKTKYVHGTRDIVYTVYKCSMLLHLIHHHIRLYQDVLLSYVACGPCTQNTFVTHPLYVCVYSWRWCRCRCERVMKPWEGLRVNWPRGSAFCRHWKWNWRAFTNRSEPGRRNLLRTISVPWVNL